MSRLPSALRHELEELGQFGVRHTAVSDQVILAAEVRGVSVVIYVDRDTYPAEPPRLEIAREWLQSRRGRSIRGLESQKEWNRTLGIGALLRELEQRFAEDPPRRPARADRPRERGALTRLLRSIVERFRNLLARLMGRREVVEAASMPAAIQARYDEIIGERSSRVERYKEAVTQLMTQWQSKTADLERLGREVQTLERDSAAKLAEAEQLVGKLKAAGKGPEQIQGDVLYGRCQAAYEELSADLAEKQERYAELEEDADEHLAKIRDHEARINALEEELEELEDESAEVAADLATVEVEQEIADLRAGVSRAGSDEELRRLLREFHKKKAAVRITREAADLDHEAQDAEYLEVARKVEAAKRFESSVGLNPEALEDERSRE